MTKSLLSLPETQLKPLIAYWRLLEAESQQLQQQTAFFFPFGTLDFSNPCAGLHQLQQLGSCSRWASVPALRPGSPQESGGTPDEEIMESCGPGFASDVGALTPG